MKRLVTCIIFIFILILSSLASYATIPDGYFITINKSNNILTLRENKIVIGKYSVATAKEGSYTPEGKFTVVSKLINPSWGGGGYADPIVGGAPNNPLGKYWLGLSIGNGDIYGIHGTNNESSIGKYVTHGCIRMHNYELDSLFYTVDIGTNVWIGTESDLLSLME